MEWNSGGGDMRLLRSLDRERTGGRREKTTIKNNWGDKESVAACC